MFARIGICADAAQDELLTQDGQAAEQVRRRKIARLRQDLAERGLGLFASKEEMADFLQSLPAVESRRWEESLLLRNLLQPVVGSGDVLSCACAHETLDGLRQDWSPYADAVVCKTEDAVCSFGLGPEEQPISNDGDRPEIAGLAAVDALAVIADAREIAARPIRGQLREHIWRDRLEPAARGGRDFTLLDSFFAHDAARALAKGEFDSAAAPLTGLSWLLRRASQVAQAPLRVRLYTRLKAQDVSEPDLVRAMRQLLNQDLLKTLKRVQVWDWTRRHGAPDPRDLMHQRVMQLGPHAIRLGPGAGLFGAQTVTMDEACDPYPTSARDLFGEIEQNALQRFEWQLDQPDYWTRSVLADNGAFEVSEHLDVLDARGRAAA